MAVKVRLVALCALVVAGVLIMPGIAAADCALPPPPSPHVFTGVVLSVERDGRVARVRIDDGPEVRVVGTPAETGVTMVDRVYTVGARYEFHPLNARSPFQDNACTRTRQIAAGTGISWPYGLAAASGVLLLSVLLIRLAHRRRQKPHAPIAGS